jgi:hypothetical protein
MDFEHIAKVGGFYSKPFGYFDQRNSPTLRAALDSTTAYAHAHFEDPPDIRDWIWTDGQT